MMERHECQSHLYMSAFINVGLVNYEPYGTNIEGIVTSW